jgi:hypothetical protein
MSSSPNPLFGSWDPNAGTNMPGSVPGMPGTTPVTGSSPLGNGPQAGSNLNPGGLANPWNTGGIARNINLANLDTASMKNQMLPQMWDLFRKSGGDAAKFFEQLTNLGSPFYKQKQQQTAEQGAKAGNEQAGMARERLNASGAGYTPSGAGAAMFGGMGQAQAGNQEEAFLNNLFQNEQLQLAGAQGLGQMAAMFNPSQMTGQSTPSQPYQAPTFASQFDQIMSGLWGPGGGVSVKGNG